MNILRPLDLVVALKFHGMPAKERTYQRVASELGISTSQTHTATQRAAAARLLRGATGKEERALRVRPVLPFLVEGVRFTFFPTFGPEARGVPTAAHALGETELLGGKMVVWPHAEGREWGRALEPLDKCVPAAAADDETLYRSLALIDALRVGGTREREVAARLLASHLLAGGRS